MPEQDDGVLRALLAALRVLERHNRLSRGAFEFEERALARAVEMQQAPPPAPRPVPVPAPPQPRRPPPVSDVPSREVVELVSRTVVPHKANERRLNRSRWWDTGAEYVGHGRVVARANIAADYDGVSDEEPDYWHPQPLDFSHA